MIPEVFECPAAIGSSIDGIPETAARRSTVLSAAAPSACATSRSSCDRVDELIERLSFEQAAERTGRLGLTDCDPED